MHNYSAPETSVSKLHRAAIVGVRGYSGLELARILLKHPGVELVECFSTDKAYPLSQLLPDEGADKIQVRPVSQWDGQAFGTVFLATPAEASLELAPKFLKSGARVIDLSGAFAGSNLPAIQNGTASSISEKSLLAQAQYGLVPFCGPSAAPLIANPAATRRLFCLASSHSLKAGTIDPSSLVIDAKSGTTGAGRRAAENLIFSEVDGECLPYKVGKHQHLPEIREYAKVFGGAETDPFFTTHLLPVRRGIIAGLYARLTANANPEEAYEAAFSDYPLVSVERIEAPESSSYALSLKKIAGSTRTRNRIQDRRQPALRFLAHRQSFERRRQSGGRKPEPRSRSSRRHRS